MNYLYIGLGLFVLLYLINLIHGCIKNAYDKGWNAAIERYREYNPEMQEIQRQAVLKGFAKWKVINDSTGKTEFTWN